LLPVGVQLGLQFFEVGATGPVNPIAVVSEGRWWIMCDELLVLPAFQSSLRTKLPTSFLPSRRPRGKKPLTLLHQNKPAPKSSDPPHCANRHATESPHVSCVICKPTYAPPNPAPLALFSCGRPRVSTKTCWTASPPSPSSSPSFLLCPFRSIPSPPPRRLGPLGVVDHDTAPLPTQVPLAQIVEMIHVASLLHDDVIDGADLCCRAVSAHAAFRNK